jgi:ankyrin repeat protein
VSQSSEEVLCHRIAVGRMDRNKMLEDSLREASCVGDIEVVEELLNKGVNVNSKHDINGW